MAKYLLLIYSDTKRWADIDEAERGAIHGDYMTYTQELLAAGVMQGGDPLEGIDQTKTVAEGGLVTDGPHAEAAEYLGGYYVIDVPDVDTAVQWAGKLPGVSRGLDRIEVRPVAVLPDMPTA
ncbi:MAG: hypothetical protein QOE35_488 [Actinomycetota bacterium]|jgi:hypothetical protein